MSIRGFRSSHGKAIKRKAASVDPNSASSLKRAKEGDSDSDDKNKPVKISITVERLIKKREKREQQTQKEHKHELISIKRGIPTNDELEELAEKIGGKWKRLGRGLHIDESKLLGIHEYILHEAEKGYRMLLHWKQKKRSAATYQALHDALQHNLVQRQDLADQFCHIHVPDKGERFEAAYQRALKSGKTKDKRVKIQVIGQDRVGKTSLVRSLKGEPFREDEISTDGVEMSQPLKNASKQPWKDAVLPEDTTVYHHRVAECINSNLVTEKAQSFKELSSASKTGFSNTDVARFSQHFYRDDAAEEEEDLEERRIPPKIAKLVEVTEQKSFGSSDGIWPVIWDFAGQSVFRAIHPIFMTLAAVYILVFDLTKELSATAQCRVREEGYDNVEILAPDSEDTNLDHIMRWLDLVHSFSENNQTLPAVMLVGTHADGVHGDPKGRMDAVINTFVDSAEVFNNHIEDTFIVDNTTAGQLGEEDPIVRLREEVLTVAEKLPHTKDEIPLTWFKVEDAIYTQVTQGEKYITTQKFKDEIADKNCKFDMENDDFEVLLRYLHDRGTIVYHDRADNPDGLVVLDPQWLIEVICKIITIKTQQKEKPRIRRFRRDLGDKGILRAELLEHSCKAQQVEDIQQPLVYIMKKFNLVCEWKHKGKSSDYVVPCMLTKNPDRDLVDPTLKQQEPVYITFNTNYVPCGLFSRLLVFFWEWAASKTNCEEQQLFANAARFLIGENTCAAFVCSKTVIKIYILVIDRSKPVEKDVSLDLIRVLKCRLNELRMECHWLRAVTWELCGKCPCKKCSKQMNTKTGKCFRHQKQGCSQDDCAHYVPVKRSPFACNCAKGRVLPVPQTWVQALQVDAFSGEKPDAVKQGTPSKEELEGLSKKIAEDWKPLGRRLNVTEAELTAFHKENEKYAEKAYKMLLHWKERDGKDATYKVLYDALCHELVKRKDLAQEFCCFSH